MLDVVLTVNGREYRGWKDIRITRTMEALCGSFTLSVSERWEGQRTPWPIREGDECSVRLGNQRVITGYVDSRSMSLSANDHSFQVVGRDKAGDLVDCSVLLDAWEFTGIKVDEICKRVAAQFGVTVSVVPGAEIPDAPPRVVVNPGESAYEVIDRACRLAGLFAMSDGDGNILLTVAALEGASTPITEGQNVLEASVSYDASASYRRYIVTGQQQGGDMLEGTAAASVRGEAVDLNAPRAARALLLQAEGAVTIQQASDRANWEASVRRARALELSVTVQGWEQADGRLWPVNAIAQVNLPTLGLTGTMLISEVTYSLAEGAGTTTELLLRPADAFLPQPEIPEDEAETVVDQFAEA